MKFEVIVASFIDSLNKNMHFQFDDPNLLIELKIVKSIPINAKYI